MNDGLQGGCKGLRRAARGCEGLREGCAELCGAVRSCTGTNMCCQLQEAAVLWIVEVSEGKSPSVTA